MAKEEPAEKPGLQTKPPEHVANVATWVKVAEVGVVLLGAILSTNALTGTVSLGVGNEKLISVVVGLTLFGGVVVFYYLWQVRPLTLSAANLVRDTKILKTNQREDVANRLLSLDWRARYFGFAALVLVLLLAFSVLHGPVFHLDRPKESERVVEKAPAEQKVEKVPDKVEVATAKPFTPANDAELLLRAPFLKSIHSSLAVEGQGEDGVVRIITIETAPFPHPTPVFGLEIDGGEGRFRLTGYAFRLRPDGTNDMYEPLPVDLERPGSVRFEIPPSKKGDRVFAMMRATLAKGTPFPDSLKREFQVTTHPVKEPK